MMLKSPSLIRNIPIGESGQISTTALISLSYPPRHFRVIHPVMPEELQLQPLYWNIFFLPMPNSFNNWLKIVLSHGLMQAYIFVQIMKQRSAWVRQLANILLKPG